MARNKAIHAIAAKLTYLNHQSVILTNPNCSPSKWRQVARSMSGLSCRVSPSVSPLLITGETRHIDDLKKANLLNDTFINQTHRLP